MQDKQLLGDNPNDKSTVSATSDMSQSLIPKDFQFKPVKPAHKDLDVTAGDMFKAVGSGALRSVAGFGELSENLFGVGESLRDLANSGADSLTSSMTEDGQAAVNSRLLEDNENGNPTFSDAAGDIDVWAMKIADGLGSLVTNFAGGGVAGGAAKIALKNTIAKSMLKKGFGSEAAGLIADKAISISASTGAVATGMGTSLGGASLDAYNATMALDSGWLAENSDYFKQAALRLSELPENEGKSATEIFDLAKEETARYASAQMSTDPTAIAASVAGAMGDKYLFGALLGKMGKGAVSGTVKGAISEGGTEFIEGYGQTVAQNQIVGDVTGQDIDPTEGAMSNALEGMLIGGALGAPIGTVGGAISKRTASDDDQDVNPPAETPTPDPDMDSEPVANTEPQQPAQEPEARTRRPLFNGDSVKSYLSDANKLKGELANFKTNKRNKELVDDLSSGLDRHTNALVNNPDMSPEDIQTAQRGLQNIFTQYQQLYSPEATFDSIYQSPEPMPTSENESVTPSDGSNVIRSDGESVATEQGITAVSGEGQVGTPTDSATHSDVVLQQQRISNKLKQLRAQKPDSQEYADLDSAIQGYGESLNAPQQSENLQAVKSHFDVIELAVDGELNRPSTNQTVSPKKEGQTTRQALVSKGVLPERNADQEVIDLARAWDPDRARDIETALRSDSISKTEASKLETEYENMATQASAAGVDPLATNFDRRVESNRQDMANREKPVERAARKGQEYDLSDSITRRRKAIREEIQQSMLPEDRADKRKLERMVDLEYSRRYPNEEQEATEQVDNGLDQFQQPEFSRESSQRAIEARAQQASNAAKVRESEIERESREPGPEENPNWFGTNPRTGERTTRSYMRDIANREAQSQLSEDKAESERIETRQANLTNRREQLAEPVSGFGQRPNSMKMREDGKKPIRDFTGINAKTTRMSKRLRKRLNRAKGFDSDAVLQELQQHEKRLAAYEQAARDRAEQEANNPENIKRRKSAESLFQEYISDPESKEFAESEITRTIRNIANSLEQSPSTVLEFDGQSMPVAKVRAQLANGVRTLADKYLGKTAAMMEGARQKKAQRDMEETNESSRSVQQRTDEAEPESDSIIEQARAVIRDVIERNGGPKPSMKGVRTAYRDAGFTADELQKALGDQSISAFESQVKKEVADEQGKPGNGLTQQEGGKVVKSEGDAVGSGDNVTTYTDTELELNQDTSREQGNGSTRTSTGRSNEGPTGQSNIQENVGPGTTANSSSAGSQSSGPDNANGSVGNKLPDSGERSVPGSTDERLSLDDVDLAAKTPSQRIAANIEAIRILKELTQTQQPATLEQKKILAQYSGWGGLGSVFDASNTSKSQRLAHAELKALLTEEEYNNAAMSVRNAHYTSETVVKAMWDGVKAFGLGDRPINVLEPSIGSGNFIGWQPNAMRDQSTWFASELDTVTGNIAKLIYPDADVHVKGFEETPFKNGVFSLAIGNPPFGSTPMRDSKNPDISGMSIHNYFIAKSAKLLHENGLLMMVVTNRFLDTLNKNHRQLSKEVDFVGAVRLPNNAFKGNANTDVVTDIVVFRKLKAGEKATNTLWTDVEGEINGFPINKWFEQNPQLVLGEVAQGTMYRGDETESTVNPTPEHADLGKSITKALSSLAKGQDLSLTNEAKDAIASQVMLTESDLAIDGMMLSEDGKIMRRGMDHPVNGAQIYEVTEDTIWSDEGMVFDHMRQLVEQGDRDKLDQLLKDEVLNSATGKPKSEYSGSNIRNTASNATVAYLNSNGTKRAALDALNTVIDKARLGKNPFRKLKSLLALRNTTLALVQAEKTGSRDIEALRQRLNIQYDEFAKVFATKGNDGKPASIAKNLGLLNGDLGIESGLDHVNELGEVSKSDIFKKRMLFPYKRPETAKGLTDAVNYSIREYGQVNTNYISELLGKDKEAVLDELTSGDKPYLLMNPLTDKYEFIDDYLSGDVKAKYQAAKKAGLDVNAKLLESVLPKDKAPDQVKPSIRATWIDPEIFERFADALGYQAKVVINRSLGATTMTNVEGNPSVLGSQFKHDRATIDELFNSAANGKSIVIYDPLGQGERVKNEKATKEVNALANKLASTFETWAKNDAPAAKHIADNFNERMNTHVNRKYNGRLYLQTVGMNPNVDMRKTQLDGALRMIQSKNTLLDHTVGAGKTFTAITGMMERRRLGLSKKPMAVVPNHILGSFHKDIIKLYPGAKVLVADDKNFSAKKRKQFFSRIATGDYDIVLLGHSHLRAMPNDIESFRSVINEKIDELRSALHEARADAKASGQRGSSVSQIEESIKRLNDKIKDKEKQLSENADKIGFNFSDLGVDYMVIDEAHEFKNLTYTTRADRVVGMNDPKGSEKALDLLIKTRTVQGVDNGGVTFMTGTPISNSLVEVYTMMYYLGHDTLKSKNMSFYDSFAGSFFNTAITLEYTPTGTVKERSVLKGLNNMQQLSTLYRQFADVITQKDMVDIYRQDTEEKNAVTGDNKSTRFPIPNVKTGKRQLDLAPATEAQREYNDYLIARMEAFNNLKTKDERQEYAKIDNPLWVLTDAKKASLDARLVDPMAKRDPTGKVARAANRIKEIYDQWNEDKGAQLVFSDMSTPVKYAKASVVADLRALAESVVGKTKAKAFVDGRLKAYEDEMPHSSTLQELTDRINAMAETGDIDADQYESLEKNIHDLGASTLTVDTGFSVYDDLKASLVEQGVPEHEIAFIHDYNTTKQKEALFEQVKRGDVRVLIGSSAKMGAGTNVQNKLVALHHMDAPWRPSDMEQREGRIVRQGNEFYERALANGDPESFEVELIAYGTQGSSDPVMWQILERKSGAIEQFRNGEMDEYVETANSDADSYAEFKAASTGNPVYRLKLESDAKLLDLDSSFTAQASAQRSANHVLDRYDSDKASLDMQFAKLNQADVTEFDADEFTQTYTQAQSDYVKALATFDADMEAWSKLDAKERKAKGIKKPKIPNRPKITDIDTDYSKDLDRTLIKPAVAAIDKGKDWSGTMKLGKGLAVKLQATVVSNGEGGSTPYISVTLEDGRGRHFATLASRVQSKTIVNSSELASALHLNSIVDELDYQKRRAQQASTELENDVKDAKKLVGIDLSKLRSELQETRVRNTWLAVETAMADIKEDVRRNDTPNKFIDAETRRKVKRSTFDPSTLNPESMTHDGKTYETLGVRIPYPDWQFDSVLPALDDKGQYVHLLMSHTTDNQQQKVADVVRQPSNTPQPEYQFLADAKLKHEQAQQEAATRDIESPDADSEPSMFSRGSVSGSEESGALGKGRVNRTLVESWAANIIRDNPVIASAGDIIRVVSRESDLPQEVKNDINDNNANGTIQGVFHGGKVYVVADKHNTQESVERVLLHELAGHYGLRKLFGKNIEKALADIRTRLGGKRGVLKLAKKFDVNIDHYAIDFDKRVESGELTVDQVDDLLFDELLAHVAQMPRLAKPLERLWQKIRQKLHAMGFTKTAGYNAADLLDLIQEIRANMVNNPNGPGPRGPGGKSLDIPMFSRTGKAENYSPKVSADQALAKRQSKLMHNIKQALYNTPVIGQTLDKMGRSKYALLTLRQLGEVAGWVNKPLGKLVDNYLAEINKMTATQNTLAEEAANISQELSDWAKKHRADSDQLFSFAHDATLADVDPSDAFQSRKEDLEKSMARHERILKEEGGINSERGAKAFEQLQEDRKAYDNEDNRRREHIRLRNVWGTLNPEQRRRFRQMRDHYVEQSAKMNEALEKQINRAVEDAKVRKAMIAELRQQQERAAKGLYFPLSRHGDYWIDFVDENDERQFMMFETKGEMELNAQKLRDAGFDINTGMKAQFNEVQKASLPFVADVIKMIRSSHMNELMKNSLSDEIYQMYLRTLPARSMRRNFIHRKGVAGFSQDAIRALADQGFKQSRQQARLDHMDILDNHLDGIQKYVGKYYETYGNEMPHKVEADRMVEELNQRHEWVRNPARSSWAQKLTGLGFVWLLGLTPAAALVNLTQLVQIAIPVLGSQHGMANASKEIGIASKEFFKAVSMKGRNKDHGFLANVVKGQDKQALIEAIRQGAIDTTQAADLMGLAENPNAKYSGAWNKAMNIIGFSFHHAEVFNREVTFLAAYRLAKEKLGDHDKAVDQAIKDTFDSHYDYSSLNRARFMQSDIAAVALQFKQYSQNTTYYLWSNMLKWLKGESPEVKAMAKKQLLGTLASTFVIGGAGALPLTFLMTAINAAEDIIGDDDEPFDAETELKAMLSGAFGKDAAALIWHGSLPSIGGRISLDDLWVRSIDRDIDPDKAYMEYMKQAAGPVLGGITLSWAQGLSDMTNDRFARGLERMPPKAIKDILKTARFIREEGITTRTGSEVVGDLTGAELVGQAMGFSVGRANIQYDENNGIKNYELHVQKRRQRLVNAYYTAFRLKDKESIKEVMNKIKRFNRSEYGRLNPISNKNLMQSIKARQRNLARTANGLQVSPKLQRLVAEYDVF